MSHGTIVKTMNIQSQHTNMNGDGRVNKEQQLERRLDKSRNFNNLNAAQYDHGLNRETWCTRWVRVLKKAFKRGNTMKGPKYNEKAKNKVVFIFFFVRFPEVFIFF